MLTQLLKFVVGFKVLILLVFFQIDENEFEGISRTLQLLTSADEEANVETATSIFNLIVAVENQLEEVSTSVLLKTVYLSRYMRHIKSMENGAKALKFGYFCYLKCLF